MMNSAAVNKKDLMTVKRAYTHNGVFHADDVYSTALLQMINPDIQVYRTNDVSDINQDDPEVIVYDIGFGQYDHHQPDAEERPGGNKYCSFGLLFRDFGHLVCPEYSYETFVQDFVVNIDEHDNGIRFNERGKFIQRLNPTWDQAMDEAIVNSHFEMAVSMAKNILKNEINYSTAYCKQKIALKHMKKEGKLKEKILMLDQYMPIAKDHDVQNGGVEYIIYPSSRNKGKWAVAVTPVKKWDPYEWEWLYPNGYFQDLWDGNKPKGLTYLHPSMQIAEFSTKWNLYRALVDLVCPDKLNKKGAHHKRYSKLA